MRRKAGGADLLSRRPRVQALAYSERNGDYLYMAQVIIGPDGELLIHRHKLRPSGESPLSLFLRSRRFEEAFRQHIDVSLRSHYSR